MINQKGIIHLIVLLLLLLIVGGVVFGLFYFGVIKNPLKSLPLVGQSGPKIELKTKYKNPFDKKAQYVNPFDKYKNPFVVNR